MSWWQSALSVVGTIGKVAGVLAGATGERAVFFRIQSSGEEDYATVAFRKVNGAIMAYNQSADNAVQISFETDCARGNSGAGTVLTLPAFQALDVTQAFASMAADDFDDFTVRPSGSLSSVTTMDGDGPNASIEARGTNLPASGTVSIGRFFNLTINSSDRTLQIALIGGFALAGLILLDIRGAGKTFCRITNVLRGKKALDSVEDDNSITVTIPDSVDIDSGISAIDIVAAVTSASYQQHVLGVIEAGDVRPISKEEMAILTAMVPAE